MRYVRDVRVKNLNPYGLRVDMWNMRTNTRYRALELLSRNPNLKLEEWGRLAYESGLYIPRIKTSKLKQIYWASKAGKCLSNLGLAKYRVTVVRYGVNVSYSITDEGLVWLKDYKREVLKENT